MNGSLHFLIFRIDDRSFGLRLSQAQRVVRSVDCTPIPHTPDLILGVIDLHGELVPVLNTRRKFGFADRDLNVNDQFIIARSSTRSMVLVVDSVVGVVERPPQDLIAARSVSTEMDQIEGIIQCEDGLVLIHDLDQFLSSEQDRTLQLALTEQPGHGS
jgi:purine-binding chemotaxis protein CheW